MKTPPCVLLGVEFLLGTASIDIEDCMICMGSALDLPSSFLCVLTLRIIL